MAKDQINQHGRDMIKIFSIMWGLSILGSLLLSFGVCWLFGLSLWHLLYMIPIFIICKFIGIFIYLRVTMGFPN